MNTGLLKYREEITELVDAWVDVVTEVYNQSDDFEIEGYRFIRQECIDDIQLEEMESDAYALGCYDASFISDCSDLSYCIVKALQSGEKFKELGQHLINNGHIEEMQSEYSRIDGYGHHFAHHDHATHEIGEYYAFRIA